MFETGIRQVRMAMSIVWGRRIDPRNVERLIGDALKTFEEFGEPGDDADQLIEGPFTDPAVRNDLQNTSLQRTARRVARVSPFYRDRFARTGLDPRELTVQTVHEFPVTTKADLIAHSTEFLAEGSQPYAATRTTGTTGRPAEIWLSQYELALWPAMSALSGLLRGEIQPGDVMQVNVSSRATATIQINLTICRLVGARARILGIIAPDEALNALADNDEPPTMLATYPSYLAELVSAARRRGLGPEHFRLRRIDCGGELLSGPLTSAARATFGASVNDNFGMTEILPVSGRTCSQGHLHPDLNMGLVEVIDLDTGNPAAPGRLGTLVVTPYYPYRECMPVVRYDTRDVVQALAQGELGCELNAVPATSRILGKVDDMITVNGQSVTSRDLVEVCEALPGQPWPARYQVTADRESVDLRLPAHVFAGLGPGDIDNLTTSLRVPVRVSAAGPESEPTTLRRVRADLLETTFAHSRS